jgi:Protein of unknown function (DUF3822)
MARKKAGFYSDTTISGLGHDLTIELGDEEMVCMTKSIDTGLIDSFELFSFDKDATEDWNDIFYEIKTLSATFNKQYKQVFCYFNTEESILIPEKFLTASSAEDYLNLVYGDNPRMELKYEKLHATKVFINAYRIKKSITELLNRQFIIFQTAHSYSNILNEVMRRPRLDEQFIKIQFYTHHFIFALWKGERLQMIQTFPYKTAEDLLYYLLRIEQQFALERAIAVVEVSGMIDIESNIYKQITHVFQHVHLDAIQPTGVFKLMQDEYPAHYFTPFFKLTV